VPAESLSFDITAHDNASRKFRDVGDAALSASALSPVLDTVGVRLAGPGAAAPSPWRSHGKRLRPPAARQRWP
jgi:hypothetical protein